MEELDPVSAQIKEVYARFGLAVYQAQCVERQIAILLATKHGPGVNRITRTQYDELLRSLFKKTFGSLANRLRKSARIPGDFERSLEKALEYRNWLTHHYFWERAGHFSTEKGRLFMIAELQEIVDFLGDLDRRSNAMVKEWSRENGVNEQAFEVEIENLMQEIVRQAEEEL